MRHQIAAALAAAACVAISGMATASQASADQMEQVGVVEAVSQAAYGTSPNAGRIEMHRGDPVIHRELIETSDQGGLLAKLADGSKLTLGADSKAQIVAYGYQQGAIGDAIIALAAGSMRYVTGAMPKGHTIIYTPAASMVLTGTNVAISVDARGTTHLVVDEGAVIVRSKTTGEDTEFKAGQSVAITRDGYTQTKAVVIGDPLVDHGFAM